MFILCCYIFYFSLQFLCENSELGHYSVLCKLKALEWATQPCLCVGTLGICSLDIWEVTDSFSLLPMTEPEIHSHHWTQMKGAIPVEPNIPVVQKCSRDFRYTAHPSPLWSARCCWMFCLPAHFQSRVWRNLLDMVCSQGQRSLCNTLVPAK